jgi:alpha-glucosidase
MSVQPWWKCAVVYQIYPRSFADSDGDGVGDLEGIRRHLDDLTWLGVDAVWLSPFYPSPMADGGYDIADHCAVDPTFGTLDDFDRLLADAHERGLRVLVDWVPNHTSDRHPWFVESRSSASSPKRDWYIWRDEPNNWRAALGGGSAWTWDDTTRQYYLHGFLPEQPDLNWRNPEVADAMLGVLRFWLDRGVDGFRIDVAHCVGKDPTFADNARCLAGEPLSSFNDDPYSHEVLRRVRRLVDGYPGDRVIVGEVNIRVTRTVARYYGAGDELHLSFNFPPLDAPWDPIVWHKVIEEVETELGAAGAWPTWVLSNHDNVRHRTRYGGSLQRARAAAVMVLTLRGTPFLFQGDELGLEDARVPFDSSVDPGRRDASRAPIPWTTSPPHGWPTVGAARPWLPFPPEAERHSVEAQRASHASVLSLYRRLLAERRSSAALQLGRFSFLDAPADVIAYRRWIAADDRAAASDERVVVVNFADRAQHVPIDGDWTLVVTSEGSGAHDAGRRYGGTVAPEEAVLLAPRTAPGYS